MSDYFELFEQALKSAVGHGGHLHPRRPWYRRGHLPIRHRGLALVGAALVIATPALAAVGAASGWFSRGKPDVFYPASATSGAGKAIPGTRMLSIRVADPGGGPQWGLRLVKTTRGETCLQVGRVEYGELGSLGIDDSWGNDRKFHPISPNDSEGDICGATDSAGHGFVSSGEHGWPASAYTPTDYGTGTAFAFCQAGNHLASLRSRVDSLPKGSNARSQLEQILKRQEAARSKTHTCPAGSLRMIFVGLLGPDAKSISYETPSGTSRTENTVGGVGAYLVVFKQTASDCNDFSRTVLGGSNGCQDNYGGTDSPVLRGPNAVTSVTYNNGKSCTDQPSPALAAAFKKFSAQSRRERNLSSAQARARFEKFLSAHHLTLRSWFAAIMPQCQLVGWVAATQKPLSAAQVTAPLKVSISEGRRFCSKGPWSKLSVQDNTITCDQHIPKGYTSYWESSLGAKGPLFALIRVSFTARQAVKTVNGFYRWNVQEPGNNGGGGNRTQANVRRGETVTFTMSEPIPGTGATPGPDIRGVYHGTISFTQDVGQAGPENGGYGQGSGAALTVGTFSFRLPPRK
jgi:hypothetical protein